MERDSLRDVIANDAYAATFQSLGQYRAALIQHMDNLDAAARAAQHIIESEKVCKTTNAPSA